MFRVAISDDYMFGSVKVYIGRKLGNDQMVVAKVEDSRLIWGEPYAAPTAPEVPATFYLPDEVAEALYIALGSHYGSPSDSRQLRADYDAERKRVDKLTDTVSILAEHAVQR